MKTSLKIFRILTCVFTAIYTALAGFHVGETAKLKSYKMAYAGGAYWLEFDRITSDAWFYIISGVVLLLLCAATVVFLFRKGWISAVIASAATTIAAIYAVLLNTQLSEVMLWNERLRRLGVMPDQRVDICLSIKPSLARLCILSALCYAALCTVEYIRSRKKLGEENEQDS